MHPLNDGTETLATGAREGSAMSADEVITLIAERVKIEKREVETGLRVRIVTATEDESVSVPLRSERIDVVRVPVGRVVQEAPAVREEDGVTIIPVMEQVVVTEVRLVLKEELHVRRISETREHQQTVQLRRQRAEVERLSGWDAASSTPTPTKD